MKLNKLTTTAVAAVFMSAVSSANASSLWLETSTPAVAVGETIEITVNMDFTGDPTLGGNYSVFFDPALVSYVGESFITDPALVSDPSFTRDDNPAAGPANRIDTSPEALARGELADAAFGNFAGLEGPAMVAPLTFTAIAAGFAEFGLEAEGFFQASGEFGPQFPETAGVGVEIGPSAIPVPAAVWLFGSGLLGLIGMARRRTTA